MGKVLEHRYGYVPQARWDEPDAAWFDLTEDALLFDTVEEARGCLARIMKHYKPGPDVRRIGGTRIVERHGFEMEVE